MKMKLHPSQAVDQGSSMIYVGGNAWVNFGGPQFIDKNNPPKAQSIETSLLPEAVLQILKSVQAGNRYILAPIGTDTSGDPSSETPVGIFKITEETLELGTISIQKFSIDGSQSIISIANTSEAIGDYIDTLRVSTIPTEITIVTDRKLTPEEIAIIKATGTINRYVTIIDKSFDGESVGYELTNGTESDITKVD